MTDALTRRQLLPPRGGWWRLPHGAGRARGLRRQRPRKLRLRPRTRRSPRPCASRTGRSTSTRTRRRNRHPTLDRVQEEVRARPSSTPRTSTTTPSYFGKIQGPLSRGQSIDRDIIVMTDNSRYPSLMIKKGWVEKLDKIGDPEHQEPAADAAASELGPEPRLQPALAVRSSPGSRTTTSSPIPCSRSPTLLENPKLKGKITLPPRRWATRCRSIMAANGDDPTKVTDASWDRRVQGRQEGRRLRRRSGNSRERLQPAAREGRPQCSHRVVR